MCIRDSGWPAVQGEVIKDSSKPKLIDDQGPHSSSLGNLEINVRHNSLNEPITVTRLVLGLQRYCVFCGLEEPLSRWTNHNIKKKPRQALMEVLSVLWLGEGVRLATGSDQWQQLAFSGSTYKRFLWPQMIQNYKEKILLDFWISLSLYHSKVWKLLF